MSSNCHLNTLRRYVMTIHNLTISSVLRGGGRQETEKDKHKGGKVKK